MRRRPVGAATAVLLAVLGSLGHAMPAGATSTPCTSASMVATDFPSPAAPGGTVTFSASSTGCANPEYRFFLQKPGEPWLAQTGYGSGTWGWSSAGLNAGVYGVGVWARQVGSLAPYETYWLGTYTLSLVTCSTAWLSTAVPSVSPAGTQVTWMAGAAPCASPLFKFWVKAPGSSWYMTRDWGGSVWTWDTTGLAGGIYLVGAWAYQPKSPNSYDAYGITTFVIAGGSGPCRSTFLQTSPSPPVAPGTIVNLSVSSDCASPEYEFWVKPPGGPWQVSLSYASTGASAWDTTGLQDGTWQLGLWVRIKGWNVAYNAYYVTTFQLDVGRCSAATLAVGMPGPPPNFVAGASMDCPSPVFQYWVLRPNSSTWQVLQAYSNAANFTFTTTGLQPGPYRIGVWVRESGATARYDSYAILTYWLTG